MCCRTTIAVNKDELEEYYKATFDNEFQPTYNAAPSQCLPVVRTTGKIELAKWGFLPKWMKDKRPQGLFNTRSETIFEKPSFKNSIVSKRCLIPADGFYEWSGEPGQKQPFYITLKDKKIFSMAGIWQEWEDEKGNNNFTYSIITTKPNELMLPIHDRMPVILNSDEEKNWIDYNSPLALIQSMMDSFPAKEMNAIKISTLVNSVKNNSKELLKPIQ